MGILYIFGEAYIFSIYNSVVVDLSDPDSIDLAGTWKQEFINKAWRVQEVVETLPSGLQTVRAEPVKHFDPKSVPVLLLGNKYDLVSKVFLYQLAYCQFDSVYIMLQTCC